METERLIASVQYGDWKGSAAADDADLDGRIHKWLVKERKITDEETCVGIELYVGGSGFLRVSAIILAMPTHRGSLKSHLQNMPDPIPAKKVELEVTVEQFLKLFKRFNVVLTSRGLDLEGRTYSF